ncbi:MAG: Stp1/IreP family PP2C-type Ser/Thr phosphatase [Lachnospiraceae bacterium]|nr:Stp1/IreP family PP2C-type Ser/Thr phosphatase [Lachnospiraceae bacterium]
MLTCSSRTDIGKKRKINQDYVYAYTEKIGNLSNLFIVADGMGGHAAGDYASRTAVDVMEEFIESSFEKNSQTLLVKAVETANSEVFSRAGANKQYEGMGTTVVAATFVGRFLQVVNVGDSRLYLLRAGDIRQISVDNSLVEDMIRSGGITREQAKNHPDKNIITRAVGVKDYVECDVYTEELKSGDIIMLCSDGLTNMVDDDDICRIIFEAADLKEAVEKLVDSANEQGGKDNISVVLVKYED